MEQDAATCGAAALDTDIFQLLDLPEDIVELVVGKLQAADSSTIRELASTSHKMLQLVLEACSCLKYFDLTPRGSDPAARCISRLTFSTAGHQRSRARVCGSLMPEHQDARWTVYLPFHAVALLHAGGSITITQSSSTCGLAEQAALQVESGTDIPAAALPAITKVVHVSGSTNLPEGMNALEDVTLGRYFCYESRRVTTVQHGWLPASSATSVRRLSARGTALTCVPSHMRALDTLDVSACKMLQADWLPESSRARVHTLKADMSNMRQVPEGMVALQHCHLKSCPQSATGYRYAAQRCCRCYTWDSQMWRAFQMAYLPCAKSA
jgi:hypothetical protein